MVEGKISALKEQQDPPAVKEAYQQERSDRGIHGGERAGKKCQLGPLEVVWVPSKFAFKSYLPEAAFSIDENCSAAVKLKDDAELEKRELLPEPLPFDTKGASTIPHAACLPDLPVWVLEPKNAAEQIRAPF